MMCLSNRNSSILNLNRDWCLLVMCGGYNECMKVGVDRFKAPCYVDMTAVMGWGDMLVKVKARDTGNPSAVQYRSPNATSLDP